MAGFLRKFVMNDNLGKLIFGNITKRHLLSAAFGQPESLKNFMEERKQDTAGLNLSSICLLIDRCSERKLPFSSLTMDNLVHTIQDRGDLQASMYYLHKFRHSDGCYFLRPWTTHFWIQQCLKYDAIDLALKAIDENSQYGIFPDTVSYCLLLNQCIENENFDQAFKIASHMFISETLDSKVSQISCLFVILKIFEKEGSLSPQSFSGAEQRNLAGLCLRLGELLGSKSLKILGLSKLGWIEKESGIRSVYQDPWAPLMWTEGYLEKAVNEIDADRYPVHHDVLDELCAFVKDDDTLSKAVTDKISSLKADGLINIEPLIKTLKDQFLSQIGEAEIAEPESFANTVEIWAKEHRQLARMEKEIEDEQSVKRDEYFKILKLEKLAKKMAVEKLGYWEFMSDETEKENIDLFLREDYVHGSSSDIEIETRIDR